MAVTTETLRDQFIKAGNKKAGNKMVGVEQPAETSAPMPKVGKTHPEAPADGRDETPSIVSEASFIVEGQILDGQIRSQKIQQKKHELRGNIAKTDRKRMWADTEEVRRDIQRDDLDATKQRRELNREGHTQSLAAKSYSVESTRAVNNGRRQKLLNEGVTLKLDHLQNFDAAVGRSKKEESK